MKPMRVGIIGAGNISSIYCENLKKFPSTELVGIADLLPAAAQAQAEKYEIKAFTVDELISSDEVDLIINLTIPAVHGQVALQVLNAGKHVHNEKPLAPNREEAREMLRIAKEKGLTIGCAPDTFLGAAHQHVRKLIESGIIGPVVGVHGYMTSRGVESWHPNPEFFYKPGAGPMLDMGPYYLTAMVNMFGPIRRVASITNITYPERTVTSEPKKGTVIKVETPTHFGTTVQFHSGVVGQLTMSFDTHGFEGQPCIVVYGGDGTMIVPDPNSFDGWDGRPETGNIIVRKNGESEIIRSIEPFKTNSRGLGVLDTVHAIAEGRPNRASGDLAFHVLDAMLASIESSEQDRFINLETKPDQPSLIGDAEFPAERELMG